MTGSQSRCLRWHFSGALYTRPVATSFLSCVQSQMLIRHDEAIWLVQARRNHEI